MTNANTEQLEARLREQVTADVTALLTESWPKIEEARAAFAVAAAEDNESETLPPFRVGIGVALEPDGDAVRVKTRITWGVRHVVKAESKVDTHPRLPGLAGQN